MSHCNKHTKPTLVSLTEEAIMNYDVLPESMKDFRRYRIEYGFECSCPEQTIYLPKMMDCDLIEDLINENIEKMIEQEKVYLILKLVIPLDISEIEYLERKDMNGSFDKRYLVIIGNKNEKIKYYDEAFNTAKERDKRFVEILGYIMQYSDKDMRVQILKE